MLTMLFLPSIKVQNILSLELYLQLKTSVHLVTKTTIKKVYDNKQYKLKHEFCLFIMNQILNKLYNVQYKTHTSLFPHIKQGFGIFYKTSTKIYRGFSIYVNLLHIYSHWWQQKHRFFVFKLKNTRTNKARLVICYFRVRNSGYI